MATRGELTFLDKVKMWPENVPDQLEERCLQVLARNIDSIAQQCTPKPWPRGSDVSSSVDNGDIVDEGSVDGGVAARGLLPSLMWGELEMNYTQGSEVDSCRPASTTSMYYTLRPGVYLNSHVSDRLFTYITEIPDENAELDPLNSSKVRKLAIFSDRSCAVLTRADLRRLPERWVETALKIVSQQPLVELTMPCVWRCLPMFKDMTTLRSLRLEKEPAFSLVDSLIDTGHRSGAGAGSVTPFLDHHSIFGSRVDYAPEFMPDVKIDRMQLHCPNLRRLILNGVVFRKSAILHADPHFNTKLVNSLLAPLTGLTHLSLINCQLGPEQLDTLSKLTSMVWLCLANNRVTDFNTLIAVLRPMRNLQHLDLSQGDEDNVVMYRDADDVVKKLMNTFPRLSSLDISGTNLAGFEPVETVSHRIMPQRRGECGEEKEEKCSIPGLEGRKLDFLGLYGCAYNACTRNYIPADKITGDANCSQVVLAVQVYIDNLVLLNKALNELFNLFRHQTVRNHRQALDGVLAAMKAYPKDSSVQIAGSASLFYIAKGEHKLLITYQHKKEIVNMLLVAMHEHMYDQTMMRNACLTICHLNLPVDVMHCYERMVRQLLSMLRHDYRDEFIHRLGIFLLNCLACQVDGKEKELIGRLGAVETMLMIIQRKLHAGDCDDVMEVAWSTLWNVTDETAINCEKFLNKNGMRLFVACLQTFDNKPELLRNMMGLMGNIAEVDSLRAHLMKDEYVEIFSKLLDSTSDGIEVSYNACGVLSHMCFDGESAWTIQSPTRQSVMDKMRSAIKRWPIHSRRNINYRSFEPILRLVRHYETPIVQLWACWALCNLTTVSPEKYCRLLTREGGRSVLDSVVNDPRPDKDILDLANRTVHRLDTPVTEFPNEESGDEGEAAGDHHEHGEDEEEEEVGRKMKDRRKGW